MPSQSEQVNIPGSAEDGLDAIADLMDKMLQEMQLDLVQRKHKKENAYREGTVLYQVVDATETNLNQERNENHPGNLTFSALSLPAISADDDSHVPLPPLPSGDSQRPMSRTRKQSQEMQNIKNFIKLTNAVIIKQPPTSKRQRSAAVFTSKSPSNTPINQQR